MARPIQKRLVVCFDGTWNNADTSSEAATNVERIARAIRGSSGDKQQIVLYLRGVGTTGTKAQKVLGGALGIGVEDNIRAAYQFLAQNYLPEIKENGFAKAADEIYIFGFSRGAYTARSLAGFIAISGLLKRQSLHKLGDAWDYYRNADRIDSRNFCDASGAQCHHSPDILFLGVWDTVGALGIPKTVLNFQLDQNHSFHDTSPSSIVRNAFHALAIDEKRDEFVPTLWTARKPGDRPVEPEGCQIDQVWFPGVHSDIGGGYEKRGLADLSLHWMAERAAACGLDLDQEHEGLRLLPDGDLLNARASQHESRVSFSWKDRWTPTYRRICETDFATGLGERIDFPRDEKTGEALATIKESLHPKLAERWNQTIDVLSGEDGTRDESEAYRPKNLAPFFENRRPVFYAPRAPVGVTG